MKRIIASESKIADLFKISEKAVRERYKNYRIAQGKYDFIKCIKAHIKMIETGDELKKIEIEKQKIKLGILQDNYHKVDDIKRVVMDMLSNFKSKLMALPSKASQELENIEVIKNENRLQCQEIIRKLIYEALIELSEYEYGVDNETKNN